jgi:hypothetical protein
MVLFDIENEFSMSKTLTVLERYWRHKSMRRS